MYKCKHFKIYELVPPGIFRLRGEKAWELLNPYALMMIDLLQEKHGTCTINNWFWGGRFKYSGYRPSDCEEGADLSQHRLGNGFDLKFKNVTATEVRKDIFDNSWRYRYITSLELGIPWTHLDCRNFDTSKSGILTFKP